MDRETVSNTPTICTDEQCTFDKNDCPFDRAIAEGRLSSDKDAINYAGPWMYMGKDDAGIDQFKHSDTRSYLSDLAIEELAYMRPPEENSIIQTLPDVESDPCPTCGNMHLNNADCPERMVTSSN